MHPVLRRSWVFATAALFVLAAAAGPLEAQIGGTISGTVRDAGTQRPLDGARVVVVEANLETRTDARGNFELRNVPVGVYTVQALFIGYSRTARSVTVTLGTVTTADFTLNRAPIQLDEVVVTGTAGTTEKREIGNAVTSLDVSDLTAEAPITNVQELLNARSPGLTMYKRSGLVGTSSNVQIRGAGSLNASYAPVYYIDGIRFDAVARPPLNDNLSNATIQFRSPLEFIDPGDIERIEVIKGPAASTLYGADAAGGVIQIITKKGTRGANRVQWSASVELSQSEWVKETPTNYYECTVSRQGSSSYPGCQDPSSVVFNGPDGLVTGIPESEILRDASWGGSFVLTDNPLARDPRALRKANGYDVKLSARGGGQLFNYFLSFNRMDEDGIFFNNFQNRTGGRANFEWTPTGTLSLGLNLGYTRYHAALPLTDNASDGLLRNAYRGQARARRRTDSDQEPGFFGVGPQVSNSYDYQMREERTTIGLTANFNPWPWFENRLVMGLDKFDVRETRFYRVDSLCWWGEPECTGDIIQRLPYTHTWTVDYSGSIRFRLSSVLESRFSGGMQLNARQYRRFTTNGTGLVANNINLIGSAATTEASEGFEEQTSLGFFVQEQIGWRDKLYATVALRIDDNSAFGSDFSLVAYPKVSLSYVISDEDFFNVGFLDDLKLRFAWGQAGNAPAPFTADRTYQQEKATVDGDAAGGLTTSEYGNPDLKAETGSEWELGFDASLFRNLLGLEVTYYNQRTNDALMSIPDAPSTGFNGTHLVNIGTVSNVGLEMLATLSPFRSPSFSWDMTFSFSTNKNELVSFGGTRDEVQFGAFTNSQRHREGYPLGSFWAVDAERDASGNIVYPINLLDACVWPDTDDPDGSGGSCEERYVGPPTPTRNLGLATTFTVFGNLRLFANLDYKAGHYQLCAICSINN
ncbi:MAG: SusC/RagA family TonB-linked outer membrane protein, partial [Gemmatimonadota bacterium]